MKVRRVGTHYDGRAVGVVVVVGVMGAGVAVGGKIRLWYNLAPIHSTEEAIAR